MTPVTTAAYRRCVDAGACTPPGTDANCNWGTGRNDHPINCVDWKQATAFCEWVGGRLPDVTELMFAATGGNSDNNYPWSDDDPDDRACWSGKGSDLGRGNQKGTCPVGAHLKGTTATGLQDLAGNVAEWTNKDPAVPSGLGRDTCGGSWQTTVADLLRGQACTQHNPDNKYSTVGFRCVL